MRLRTITPVVVAVALCVTPVTLTAQSQSPPPPTTNRTKVDVVLTRSNGEKKVASLPYTLWVAGTRGTASIRMGVDVPIGTSTVTAGVETPTGPRGGPTGSRSSSETTTKMEYRYVGTAVDCFVTDQMNGTYLVQVNVQDSSIFSPESETKPVPRTVDPMAFRTFTMSNSLILRDGQSLQFVSATDKISGETLKVDVTLTVVK